MVKVSNSALDHDRRKARHVPHQIKILYSKVAIAIDSNPFKEFC